MRFLDTSYCRSPFRCSLFPRGFSLVDFLAVDCLCDIFRRCIYRERFLATKPFDEYQDTNNFPLFEKMSHSFCHFLQFYSFLLATAREHTTKREMTNKRLGRDESWTVGLNKPLLYQWKSTLLVKIKGRAYKNRWKKHGRLQNFVFIL